jgi:hypothetical protein
MFCVVTRTGRLRRWPLVLLAGVAGPGRLWHAVTRDVGPAGQN